LQHGIGDKALYWVRMMHVYVVLNGYLASEHFGKPNRAKTSIHNETT